MDLKLQEKIICITGGSRGVGRATALALLGEGARVGVCARDESVLQNLIQEADESASKLMITKADVRDEAQVKFFIESMATHFGGIDGLIVNAGSGVTGNALLTSDRDFIDQFNIKTVSALNTVRAALPYLRSSTAGRIVIINGVTAHSPDAEQAAVSSARASLSNLSVLLSHELAVDGICVNRVNLGPILTKRQQSRYQASASPLPFDQWITSEALRRQIPLGRMGNVAEVVPWILMLVSPLASFVTGAEINVAGGLGTRV